MSRLRIQPLVCLLCALAPATALAATGGPDGFGYTWADSDEAGVTYDYEFTYDVVESLGDEDFIEISIGFDFEFYGCTYDEITLTSNGMAHFDGADVIGYENESFPYGSYRMISPFWDDLDPNNLDSLYYEVTGSSPNRVLLVEWWDIRHYDSSAAGTFELKLFEVDGAIEFHYEDVNFDEHAVDYGASATVGIQDGAQGYALQRSFDQPELEASYAVRFEPPSCADADGDGYQDQACGGSDCDDSDGHVYPGQSEDCNGVDDDCDGTVDEGCGDDDDSTPSDDDDDSTPSDDDDADDDTDPNGDDDTDGPPWGDDDTKEEQDPPQNLNPTFGLQCNCRQDGVGVTSPAVLLIALALMVGCRRTHP